MSAPVDEQCAVLPAPQSMAGPPSTQPPSPPQVLPGGWHPSSQTTSEGPQQTKPAERVQCGVVLPVHASHVPLHSVSVSQRVPVLQQGPPGPGFSQICVYGAPQHQGVPSVERTTSIARCETLTSKE